MAYTSAWEYTARASDTLAFWPPLNVMPGGRQHYRLQTPAPDEQPPAWCGLLNCTSVTDNGYIALLQDVEVGLQCTRVNGGAIKLLFPWTTKNNVGLHVIVCTHTSGGKLCGNTVACAAAPTAHVQDGTLIVSFSMNASCGTYATRPCTRTLPDTLCISDSTALQRDVFPEPTCQPIGGNFVSTVLGSTV